MLHKTIVRQMIHEFRDSLWDELVLDKSRTIEQQVLESSEYRNAESIFIYKGAHHETDTDDIILHALAQGKIVALPKIVDNAMVFFSIESLNELKKGYFGLSEPEALPQRAVTPDQNSMIIVPGVAFDRGLNRLGYGKGFYDRWLADYPEVFRAGIAFKEQIFDCIETDAFDIPMHRIYTDGEIIGI